MNFTLGTHISFDRLSYIVNASSIMSYGMTIYDLFIYILVNISFL